VEVVHQHEHFLCLVVLCTSLDRQWSLGDPLWSLHYEVDRFRVRSEQTNRGGEQQTRPKEQRKGWEEGRGDNQEGAGRMAGPKPKGSRPILCCSSRSCSSSTGQRSVPPPPHEAASHKCEVVPAPTVGLSRCI